ncbi:hypothetical protein SAMN05444287_1575 [Octadecabacter temperatus]|uniref:Uncharacterized protein n=1 Tax=Octadecabacter temperatus TaxID=1458307 RepID=A0A0K0Y664_9RHOB|nr:hypothetical protein OSB_19190 [Octadecabacter temperatus]SIO14449.1 hypothetical protein SAMN05444287_1575 [Octadecabacter temperatus]
MRDRAAVRNFGTNGCFLYNAFAAELDIGEKRPLAGKCKNTIPI